MVYIAPMKALVQVSNLGPFAYCLGNLPRCYLGSGAIVLIALGRPRPCCEGALRRSVS